MKVYVRFLAIYVLILAGIPCPDADCCYQPETTTPTEHHPRSDSPDEHHSHHAPCSPFCHCATCVGFTFPISVQFESVSPPLIRVLDNPFFTHQFDYFLNVIAAIWQPPRPFPFSSALS